MIVNLIIIFIILSLGLVYSNGKSSCVNSPIHRKRYIILVCAILVLQSGLRNVAVGADTYQYYLNFERVKSLSWSQIYSTTIGYYTIGIGKAPGYLVLQKIVQYLLPNYQLFLLLIAIIFFLALGNFIYKNTTRLSNAVLAFVLYSSLFYSFFSITGHRQTLATACTIFSYEFIKQRKLLLFLILIVLASTIHKSVLVFIPFYFIARIENTKYYYSTIVLLFPIFMYFREPMSLFLKTKGGYTHYGVYEGAGTLTFTLMLLLVAVFARWRLKSVLRLSKQKNQLYNAFALAILFTPLTWVNPSAMRIVQYFSIYMLLLIPTVIQSFQDHSKETQRFVFVFTILLLIILFIKSSIGTDYKFFWQEMQLGLNYS